MKCTKCDADVSAGYNYHTGFMCPECGSDLKAIREKAINDEVMRIELLENYFKFRELRIKINELKGGEK